MTIIILDNRKKQEIHGKVVYTKSIFTIITTAI